jgi:hypothetical protein
MYYIKVVFTFLEQKQCAPARQATLNHVSANQTLIYTENRIATTQIQTQEPCTQIRTNKGTFCSIFLTNVIYCFALFIISGKALQYLMYICLYVGHYLLQMLLQNPLPTLSDKQPLRCFFIFHLTHS